MNTKRKFNILARENTGKKLILIFCASGLIILSFIIVLIINNQKMYKDKIDSLSKAVSVVQSKSDILRDKSANSASVANQSSALSSDEYQSSGDNHINVSGDISKAVASNIQSSLNNDLEYIPLGIESTKGKDILDDTKDYFSGQILNLSKAMRDSNFYFSEKLLDETSKTSAYIIAKDENYAQNLNGYFYYLFDKTGSSEIISPFVLNISVLFEETERDEVFKSGEYAQRIHLNALKSSLNAALGKYYTNEVFDFIYEGYKETFSGRISGQPSKSSLYKLKINELEIIFHNSFLTYIEFFIVK